MPHDRFKPGNLFKSDLVNKSKDKDTLLFLTSCLSTLFKIISHLSSFACLILSKTNFLVSSRSPKKYSSLKLRKEVRKLNNKLYVGGLDYAVTGDQLGELFAQAGKVEEAIIINDRYSGQSKGFGFVTMSNNEEAKKAKEMFAGKEIQGRNVIVSEARPQKY